MLSTMLSFMIARFLQCSFGFIGWRAQLSSLSLSFSAQIFLRIIPPDPETPVFFHQTWSGNGSVDFDEIWHVGMSWGLRTLEVMRFHRQRQNGGECVEA